MVISLPYYLFTYFYDLPLIWLSIGDLTIMANLFSILLSMKNLTAIVDLFSILSMRDSILSAYLFLLPLSLKSLTISLHFLILRDPTIGLCFSTISLLSLIIEGCLVILLLL